MGKKINKINEIMENVKNAMEISEEDSTELAGKLAEIINEKLNKGDYATADVGLKKAVNRKFSDRRRKVKDSMKPIFRSVKNVQKSEPNEVKVSLTGFKASWSIEADGLDIFVDNHNEE